MNLFLVLMFKKPVFNVKLKLLMNKFSSVPWTHFQKQLFADVLQNMFSNAGLHWQIYSTFSLTPILPTRITSIIFLCDNGLRHERVNYSAHTTHNTFFWLRVKKACTETGVDQTTCRRWNENVLKKDHVKVIYEIRNQAFMFCWFLNWVIKRCTFFFCSVY